MEGEQRYPFRNTATDEVGEFGFEQMMQADVAGFVVVEGIEYRRVRGASYRRSGRVERGSAPIVSDTLGFPQHQLEDFESDRKSHGFGGVEFKRDPTEPTFFQVHCDSPQTWHRYMRHRGFDDRNSSNGSRAMMPPGFIEAAQARLGVDADK